MLEHIFSRHASQNNESLSHDEVNKLFKNQCARVVARVNE